MESIKKAGLILLAGLIFSRLGGTLFKFIAIYHLTPLEYGKLALFLIMFNWLLLIATFNTTLGLAKFVAEKRSKKELLYGSALLGSTIISLFISGLLILFSNQISLFIGLGSIPIILFLAAVLPFAVVYNITIFYFRGLYRMKASTLSDVALSAAKVILLIFLFYVGYNYPPYFAFLIAHMLIDLVLIFKGKLPKRIASINMIKIKKGLINYRMLLIYSFPIFIAEITRFLGLGIDRFFLAKFFTTSATGIYDLGISLCIGYLVIANSYANALLPVASRNHRNVSRLKTSLFKSTGYVVVLYVLYTMAILFFIEPLVNLINPLYIEVTTFVLPLMVVYALIGFLSLLTHFASAIALQKYAAYASAVFLILAFTLNFYLVPELKYLGAVEALLASSLASLVLLMLMIWRGLKSRR
ncbi:MAG: oligosaccharide flippase family protein [Candidatus Aenigmatarchaeota archaeon]